MSRMATFPPSIEAMFPRGRRRKQRRPADSRRATGILCSYCRRETHTGGADNSDLKYTRDHWIPKSAGGQLTLPCCHLCNFLKGDLMPGTWWAFMVLNPGWWEMRPRPTPKQVAIAAGHARASLQPAREHAA